jgi:diketogulonate reductase-like aldo/keto reductase
MSTTVRLFSSNISIPRIAYGTGTKWNTGGISKAIDQSLVSAIREAFSIGYRHLDCAEKYFTEASVGEAICLEGIPRDQLFITSKVYNNIENVLKACDDVLARLGVDYLNLWLIHAPFFDRNKISLEEVWKQMETLVDNGKVKAIGVSNFQIKDLNELFALKPRIRPAVNQSKLKVSKIFLQQ